jgi:chromosome segregation ATPase
VSQHPLAVHLEQGNLRFIDEEHSITDRLRTDIDEGNEVKDAVLLLRRQEIRRLERACEALMAERDERDQALQQSRVCLDQAQRQISIQSAHSESLQRKIHELEFRARQQPNELHQQIHALSRELADARMREQTRARSEQAVSTKGGLNPEMACLHERVEHLEGQLALWKAEAMGRGNKAVSVCWQDSVDEAVRREREKDRAVIVGLTREIDQLRAQSEASRAEI